MGFVAIVGGGAVGATKPSSGVGFVALIAARLVRATKPTRASVHFVALIEPAAIRATLPHAHGVPAMIRRHGRDASGRRTSATKCTLSLPTQPQLTFPEHPQRFGQPRRISHPTWRHGLHQRVLAVALLCYAALGAVLRVLPDHLTGLGAGPFTIGLAVGAPAITGLLARPAGGRLADRVGPRVVVPAGAAMMSLGVAPAAIDTVAGPGRVAPARRRRRGRDDGRGGPVAAPAGGRRAARAGARPHRAGQLRRPGLRAAAGRPAGRLRPRAGRRGGAPAGRRRS